MTSNSSRPLISTQATPVKHGDLLNWLRFTRGQPIQLIGIDLTAAEQLQVEHRDFIRMTTMSSDEARHVGEGADYDWITELHRNAETWDRRCAAELGPKLDAVMQAAVDQIVPGYFSKVHLVWTEWRDDDDIITTLHPDNGGVVYVPHFALRLVGEPMIGAKSEGCWVYLSRYKANDQNGSVYYPRLPMYTWAPEDVVIAMVAELLRHMSQRGHAPPVLALAWKAQLDIQPSAY